MNKQEAIEKLKSRVKSHWLDEEIYGDNCIKSVELGMAIDIVNQIDEPEKPVVPQFVADFYESIKDNFETKLYNYFVEFYNGWEDSNSDFDYWFNSTAEPVQTLVKMKLFGYVVKQEKLYTVELPHLDNNKNHHVVLRKLWDGKVVTTNSYVDWWRDYESAQLTEAEIKKDFEWAWKFAKEVK